MERAVDLELIEIENKLGLYIHVLRAYKYIGSKHLHLLRMVLKLWPKGRNRQFFKWKTSYFQNCGRGGSINHPIWLKFSVGHQNT